MIMNSEDGEKASHITIIRAKVMHKLVSCMRNGFLLFP